MGYLDLNINSQIIKIKKIIQKTFHARLNKKLPCQVMIALGRVRHAGLTHTQVRRARLTHTQMRH
jgi:hypothetical protein